MSVCTADGGGGAREKGRALHIAPAQRVQVVVAVVALTRFVTGAGPDMLPSCMLHPHLPPTWPRPCPPPRLLRSASALLSVRKACGIGMLGPRCADAGVYVVRHKRRRLALSPVEVDPDAEARQAAAEAAAGRPGAAKAAASSACGGPAAVGSKALDF